MEFFKEIVVFKHFIKAFARAERQKHLNGCHFKAYIVRCRTHFGKSERAFIYPCTAVDGRDNHRNTGFFAVNEEFFEVCLLTHGADSTAVVKLNHNRFGLDFGKAVKVEIQKRMRLNGYKVGAKLLRRA